MNGSKRNKRSKDLGTLLGSCSWADIDNFLQTCIKTHSCRLNQLRSGLTLRQYLTMHVSISDHIRHLNFDLSMSLKVKCDSVPIYGFLMFNSNIWPYSAPLQDISFQNLSDLDFDLSRSLRVKCDSVIGLPIFSY